MKVFRFRTSGSEVCFLALLICALFATAALVASAAEPNCAPLPTGLVSWWPAQGNAQDLAGGNSGILSNGVTFATGIVGQAFAFDGSSNYVEVPDSVSLRLTNALTIEFWVKRLRLAPPSFPYAEYILEKGGDWTGGAQNYAVALHNPQYGSCLHFLFANGWRGAGSIADTNWHHCAIVATNGQADATFYIDGQLEPVIYREGSSFINLFPSTRPLHIGAQYDPQSGWLYYGNTLVDELAFYNRGLAASEIQAIYNAGSAGKCPSPPETNCVPVPAGLLSWWPGQNNALDVVGGNNGTLSGNAIFAPGRVGQGFALDGSFDAVPVGNATNLQLQDFSIEAWVQRASDSQVSSIPGQDALVFGYGSGGYGFGLDSGGRPLLTLIDVDSLTPATGITDTNLHHLAVTKSGSNVVFYVDGAAYVAPVYSSSFAFSTPAALGARGDTLGNSFLGTIDEVSIYNRPLSPAEIQGIYNAGSAGKCRIPIAPFITTQPTNKIVYAGSNVTFNAAAGGDAPLVYQWFFNDSLLPGKTAGALSLPNVQSSNSGPYYVVVTNSAGSIISSNAVLTVNPLPDCAPITNGLVSWWRAENSLIDGWDSNNGSQPGNAATIQFANGKVGRAFSLNSSYVLVADSPSLRLTNALTIEAWINPSSLSGSRTILSKFDLPSQPFQYNNSSYLLGTTNNGQLYLAVSRTGSSAVFTSLVAGQPLPVNQWSFVSATYDGYALRLYTNGVLAAQTNYSAGIYPGSAHLGIGAVAGSIANAFSGLIDEVSLYNRALAESELRAIFTADFVGKCLVPPQIVAPPQSQSIPQGEDALFAVSILGSRPLKYQWRFNGVNQFGATNSSLLLEKVQTNKVGQYSVVVTNSAGAVTSSPATLTLLPPPACVAVPADAISWWPAETFGSDIMGTNNGLLSSVFYATGKVGRAFSFNGLSSRIQVASSPSLNFGNNVSFSIEGWIKALPPVPGPGAANPIVPIIEKRLGQDFPLPDAGYSLSLNQGRLAFGLAPAQPFHSPLTYYISSGPDLRDSMFHHVALSLNRSVVNGGRLYVDGQLVLSFDAAYGGSFSNNSPLNIGAPSPRVLSNSFFNGLIDELSIYHRALSAAEILAIRQAGAAGKCIPPPNILVQPTNQTANVGSVATFRVLASGFPALTYQWRKNATNNVGQNSTLFSISNVGPGNIGDYTVIVSNSFGATTSAVATLAVNYPPTATNFIAATIQNQMITIPVEKFLLMSSDPDGDPLTLIGASASTNGAAVVRSLIDVTYAPVNGFIGADRFTFTVSDGHALASAFVLVQVGPANQPSGNMLPLTVIPGGFRVSFAGLPARTYSLQRAESISGPWTYLTPVTVGPDGTGTYDDTNAPPASAYYRTVYP